MKGIAREDGYTTVLMCFFMLIVLAIGGLLVDAGLAMITKTKLDHATEVCAGQSATHSYDEEIYSVEHRFVLVQETARNNAITYLAINMPTAKVISIIFKPELPEALFVTTEVKLKTHFMKLFGIEEISIKSNVKGYVYEEE